MVRGRLNLVLNTQIENEMLQVGARWRLKKPTYICAI